MMIALMVKMVEIKSDRMISKSAMIKYSMKSAVHLEIHQ